MKMSLFIFLTCIVCFNSVKGQTDKDSIGKAIYLTNLKVIEEVVNGDKSNIQVDKVAKAISFFTILTGIPSDAPGTFAGQIIPNKSDYHRWLQWYHINKENIFFDKRSGNIVIHKSVTPPVYND